MEACGAGCLAKRCGLGRHRTSAALMARTIRHSAGVPSRGAETRYPVSQAMQEIVGPAEAGHYVRF